MVVGINLQSLPFFRLGRKKRTKSHLSRLAGEGGRRRAQIAVTLRSSSWQHDLECHSVVPFRVRPAPECVPSARADERSHTLPLPPFPSCQPPADAFHAARALQRAAARRRGHVPRQLGRTVCKGLPQGLQPQDAHLKGRLGHEKGACKGGAPSTRECAPPLLVSVCLDTCYIAGGVEMASGVGGLSQESHSLLLSRQTTQVLVSRAMCSVRVDTSTQDE